MQGKLSVPGTATLQLVNMSINPFEVNTLLISVQRKTLYTQLKESKSKPSRKIGNQRWLCVCVCERVWKGGNFDTHRALVISLRSFSASSKKRETTSTTKSGLLSSWSCWSCKNWPSRIPYSHQTNIKQDNQHIENANKKQKNNLFQIKHNRPTIQYKTKNKAHIL